MRLKWYFYNITRHDIILSRFLSPTSVLHVSTFSGKLFQRSRRPPTGKQWFSTFGALLALILVLYWNVFDYIWVKSGLFAPFFRLILHNSFFCSINIKFMFVYYVSPEFYHMSYAELLVRKMMWVFTIFLRILTFWLHHVYVWSGRNLSSIVLLFH